MPARLVVGDVKVRPGGSESQRWRAGMSGFAQPANAWGDLFGVGGPTLPQACVDEWSMRRKEVKAMRTYERPTLRASGSFIKKTGLGQHGPNDLIVLFGKQ